MVPRGKSVKSIFPDSVVKNKVTRLLEEKSKELKILANEIWSLAERVKNEESDSITGKEFIQYSSAKIESQRILIDEIENLVDIGQERIGNDLNFSIDLGWHLRCASSYQNKVTAAMHLVSLKTRYS